MNVETIKRALYNGKLVLIPAAGRKLGNPYYSGLGPIYHMLVVFGWDSDEFITNDPGTRRGESYKYDYATLLRAIHDWHEDDITLGTPLFIIVGK